MEQQSNKIEIAAPEVIAPTEKPKRELTELEKRFKRPAHRPAIEIDWEEAERFASYWGTEKGIAAALGVSLETLQGNIRRKYKCSFTAWAEQFRDKTGLALMEELIQRALTGDGASLRFLAERKLGLTPKIEVSAPTEMDQLREKYAGMSLEEKKAELAKMMREIGGLLASGKPNESGSSD